MTWKGKDNKSLDYDLLGVKLVFPDHFPSVIVKTSHALLRNKHAWIKMGLTCILRKTQ